MQKIKVDVVSDVVCPWCYIGKRRLEKAMNQLKDQYEFEVAYHPFELNPDMPDEGRNQKAYLIAKFGSEEKYFQIANHVTSVAAGEGLNFDFSKQVISPNTLNAHRLIAFAKKEGKQAAVKEALMSAYFEKGVDLTRIKNLVDVAVQAGMDAEAVESFLQSDEFEAEVKMEEQLNFKRGISGVPFYIINDKYGVSGAQPVEVFAQVFEEMGREISQSEEACKLETKAC